MIHEDAVEDRKCGDTEPLCACTDGRGYGSGISKTLQGAGCRPDLYGNGQCKAISFHNKNTEALMEIDPGEHPVSMQLFGSEPDLMAEVAKSIEERPL